MSLTFHETFSLERENIAKLLDVVADSPMISDVEIADQTGIGIGKAGKGGKVRPTIKYADFCGLLKSTGGTAGILISDSGKIIREYDRRLKTSVTHWIMHSKISSQETGATAWKSFTHEFLPHYSEFYREMLKDFLDSLNPDLNEKTRTANVGLLIKSYTDDTGLFRTRLFREVTTNRFHRESSNYPNAYLAVYVLAEIWEAKHADRSMVEPAVLLESGHLATTLNLTAGDLQSCLDEMSAIGAISQMREAPPFQVVRRWSDKFDLLRRAYEEY
ncbi:MAG TPA: DUF4007 family protein [Pyrinomonadaceae bacterium]|jgi:hypothetical protein